jgi:hypothetical protein
LCTIKSIHYQVDIIKHDKRRKKNKVVYVLLAVHLAKIDQTVKEMAKFSLELNYAQEGRVPK